MASANAEKIRIIACGAIAHEVLAVCRQHGLTHIDLTCLPALWHNRPEKIAPGLRAAIDEARQEGFERIFIGYGECGSKGEIDRLCREENLERLPGPHCYAFFTGTEKFMAEQDRDLRSFFLTDLICRQFEAFIVEPMKLDKHPELIEMMFGNYETLVYLAQTNDPTLDEKAKRAAEFLGLAYERRFTGYGDLDALLPQL